METFSGFLVFIFGLIIGSFLNCLIWRLYKNESLSGRSYCPRCRKQIAWYDNFPILSFVFLGGRCRYCKKQISWQYPLVELITAILFLLLFLKNQAVPLSGLLLARDLIFAAALVVIFVYDLRWQLIPMVVVWSVSVIVFIFNISLGFAWWPMLLFGSLGALFFLVQYLITKKKGVGEGDIWLGLLLGLFFPNAGQLLLLMIVAYGIGALSGVILLAKRKKTWKSQVALGPFLAFGAIITLIWGEQIINWYLNLFPML